MYLRAILASRLQNFCLVSREGKFTEYEITAHNCWGKWGFFYFINCPFWIFSKHWASLLYFDVVVVFGVVTHVAGLEIRGVLPNVNNGISVVLHIQDDRILFSLWLWTPQPLSPLQSPHTSTHAQNIFRTINLKKETHRVLWCRFQSMKRGCLSSKWEVLNTLHCAVCIY